jgi:hypothetical protein
MFSSKIESSGLNLWIRERRLIKRMRVSNAKHDTFVISLPKSGRTWHRLMVGYYLARVSGVDPKNSLKLDYLAKSAGIPPLAYTHNASSFTEKLPPRSEAVASPAEWQGKNVLLLTRDNRDVLVSSYFHSRFRDKAFDGSISEFIRHPFVGIVKILTAFNRWHENRHLAANFAVVSYENIQADPASALAKSLSFIGIKQPDQRIAEETVKFGDFRNLQQMEQTDYFQSQEMRNSSNDPRGRKIRSGKVGGFREHLSDEDLSFIEKMEREMGNPFSPNIVDPKIN